MLGKALLRKTDAAAKRQNTSRSALVREALKQHLKRLHELDLEEQDRGGYHAQPQPKQEFGGWEQIASWPED